MFLTARGELDGVSVGVTLPPGFDGSQRAVVINGLGGALPGAVMTRGNRPDTLFTRLREIERRLGLLEDRRAATSALTSVASQSVPVPFVPAREQDWPGTDSPEWTDLVRTLAMPGRHRVVVDAVADTGTSG